MIRLVPVFLLLALFLQGGGEVFEDPEGKYSLTLPTGWSGIVGRDGLGRPDVKVVYRVNEHGTLKIRRVAIEEGTEALAFARNDEQSTLRFQPGYAKGAIETFLGGVNGALVTYDYTSSGRAMMGRAYYVKANPTTIFVLRFTGVKNILGPLRNQTDAMARSLKGQ